MTPDDADFPGLIRRAGAGDDDAREELFLRYGRAVRRAVQRQMPTDLRRQFDSLDFAQDVWAAFLALPADRVAFDTPTALASFLALVARNKMLHALEAHVSAKAREFEYCQLPELGHYVQTPSQHAIAAERWDELMAAVPPGYRPIVERLRDGHTYPEIAAGLNVSVRTVERVVRRLRQVYEKDG